MARTPNALESEARFKFPLFHFCMVSAEIEAARRDLRMALSHAERLRAERMGDAHFSKLRRMHWL
jgi:hypothetical protein